MSTKYLMQQIVLNELVKEVHQTAVEHGWWEEPKTFGELIALIHSEASEALEEFSFKIFKDWFDAENIKSKTNPSAYLTKVFDKVLLTGLFSKKRIETLAETIRIAKTPWLGGNN